MPYQKFTWHMNHVLKKLLCYEKLQLDTQRHIAKRHNVEKDWWQEIKYRQTEAVLKSNRNMFNEVVHELVNKTDCWWDYSANEK